MESSRKEKATVGFVKVAVRPYLLSMQRTASSLAVTPLEGVDDSF
jgi:hypothetical protein